MIRAFAAGLLLVCTAGAAAAAEAPTPADIKVIEGCLTKAATAKTSREACIGRVTDPCLDKADNTADQLACSDREFLVWDARLNRDYAKLISKLEPDAKAALREIEKLFIAMKAKKCEFDYVANGGGTMWSVTGAQCATEETARQSLWLADKIDMLSPQ
jgi:uncharacterized protein YecT (DUF1311 family)